MEIGDVITPQAMWLDGTETKALRAHHEAIVLEAIDDLCREHGVTHSPIEWSEIGPEQVEEVPDHIQGPNVRLLIAEATVTGFVPAPRGFIGELDRNDLALLRAATRRRYALANNNAYLNDVECDDIIEGVGPEVALDSLRRMN